MRQALPIIIITFILYIALNKYKEKTRKVVDSCIKNRYIIAIITFIVLVICKVNFSSIGIWSDYIREGVNTTIFGVNRGIRSDEWLVTTPFNLSQQYNRFQLVNNNVDIGNNDMNIFHTPVLDFSIIVRIFSWGYILFGNEVGLSWAWVLKLIVMFMIFWELGMILTKKDKSLSFLVVVWITFSPVIMWYSILDTIAFAMGIIVLFHAYVSNQNLTLKKKLFIAYGMIVFLCQFAYALYPAWQIPLVYIIIAFIIVDMVRYRKNLSKKDYMIMGITLLITILFMVYFVVTSWDGIQAMINTKYPGGRIETGGDYDFSKLTDYYTNFFTPYTADYENPCILASFIYPSLAVIIILLIYIIKAIKENKVKEILKEKNNWYLFALIIVLGIFLAWMSFSWPTLLAKITLLYTSPTKRTAIIFQFSFLLLTVLVGKKLFDRKEKLISKKLAFAISLVISILTYFVAKNSQYAQTYTVVKYIILLTFIFLMNYTYLSSNKKAFAGVMIVISLWVGIYVNPINIGTKTITGTELAKQATSIAKEDSEGIWIGGNQINSQYLIANGLKVLNGINQYPNYEWVNILDPDHKQEEIWNRYAHIMIKLDKETKFELISKDAYNLYINYEDLKKLNIKYYYTNDKVDFQKMEEFKLETLYENDFTGQYIYKIN